jgi:NAD(P)-dependent dehydrogenase (short-subunit alcohol dehydrogenase family)
VELACLNAGVTTGETDVRDVSDEAYRRIRGANLDGVVYGVRRLADVLEPGSAIVVTASLAGLVAAPQDPLYTLTKHGVVGFVRAVAPQLAERGVRIGAVAPGFVDTPLLASGRDRFVEAGFPLLEPVEVAGAILAAGRSDETGQVWVVQPGPRTGVVPLRQHSRPARCCGRACRPPAYLKRQPSPAANAFRILRLTTMRCTSSGPS